MEFTKDIEFNTSPTVGQELTLTYSGFLGNSAELTIVYGFGESWNNTTETPMEKTESGFSVKINMLDFDTFNFCFRNSNYEWDNNSNCNYITSITPCTDTLDDTVTVTFDIDALIEELLQPLTASKTEDAEDVTITSTPIDLGVEIANILSQIKTEPKNLVEYDTIDEILAGEVIDQTPVELFEETPTEQTETSLVALEDPFTISPRKLSRFYSFRKHLKLSLYKLFVKIPKLIFGSNEE